MLCLLLNINFIVGADIDNNKIGEIKCNSSKAAALGVISVDIYNKTVVKMNTPKGLYLAQYQNATIENDGKLYITLAPASSDRSIHIYNPTSPNGLITSVKLKSYAGASYIGIY